MAIKFVAYSPERAEALEAFNSRLAASGQTVRFQVPGDPHAPSTPFHQGIRHERYLAVDDEGHVRGAYCLKMQQFWCGGDVLPVADIQLPISEAIVDSHYAFLAIGLLADAQKRQPMLYGLGMGGFAESIARLLKAAGWTLFAVPFWFHIVHPFAFFRNIAFLRKTPARRLALDALAFTGLGWLMLGAMRMVRPAHHRIGKGIQTEVVEQFCPWADGVWNDYKNHYRFCSLRDAATLDKMYPRQATGFRRLKITANGRTVGWSLLLNTRLTAHAHFGNMRVGSIVDCLADPPYAADVIAASRRFLIDDGADLIVSNQSHRIWQEAFRAWGFQTGPSNFIFASSRALTKAMQEKQIAREDVHVNRSDGDGPIHL